MVGIGEGTKMLTSMLAGSKVSFLLCYSVCLSNGFRSRRRFSVVGFNLFSTTSQRNTQLSESWAKQPTRLMLLEVLYRKKAMVCCIINIINLHACAISRHHEHCFIHLFNLF